MPANDRSILLLRLSSLGDILLTTPLILSLRNRYPNARIDLVITKEFGSLIPILEGLTEVYVFDKKSGLKGLHKLRRELKSKGYDHVLDLHNNLRTRLLRTSLSPKITVIDKRTFKRWMLVRYKYNVLQEEPDVIGRYFETARDLEVTDNGQGPMLNVATTGTSLLDSRRIAIAPGAKHWNKRWPETYYRELTEELINRKYSIDLHGAESDRVICDFIADGLPTEAIRNYAGKLSLSEAAIEISKANLAITNDSGLMHMAQAVGVRTISFFGPTVKQFGFAPRDPHAIIQEVEGLYCRPCTAIGLSHCPEKHFRCMRETLPNDVMNVIELGAASQ